MATAALICTLAAGRGGGGSSGGGPAGVDSSKPVSGVSEADKGSLCDWFVAMVGGYGATSSCATADLQAPPDRSTCVATFPACDGVTVAQLADCVQRLVSAQNICTVAARTMAVTSASCTAAAQAGCFN